MHEIAWFLREHPPFDTLEEPELEAVAAACEIEFAAAGTVLTEQGAPPATDVRVIRRGSVALIDSGVVIDLLGEGELFGHTSMLAGEPSQLTVKVHEDSLFYRIGEAAIRPVLGRPAALRFVVRSVGGRYEMRSRDTALLDAAAADPARRDVGSMVRSPPLIVEPATSIQEAARRMVAAGQSSLLIDLNDSLGIVTDLDFRGRVVAAGIPSETAVSEIMTVPARTVSADSSAVDALMEMLDRGISHLPVLDAHRHVVGVIADTDLLAVETRTPFHLRRAIGRADDRSELAAAAAAMPGVVVGLHDARVAPGTIERVITTVHDAMVRRLLELAERELGPPPERFTWFALGSHARREAVPSSDGDSALAWDGASEQPELREAMLERARWVTDGLRSGGIPPCDQGAVASMPLFARSVASWTAAADAWMRDPSREKALILVSVLVDGRAVSDEEVAVAALSGVLQQAPRHPAVLRGLARMALAHRPPTGFFRDFVVSQGGERSGTLDIKRGGLLPVVDLARWAGMAAGVASASTTERLRAAGLAGTLPKETVSTLLVAFELFSGLRISHQVEALRLGAPPDDRLDPKQLDPLTRRHLKDAFRTVAGVQRGIATELEIGSL